MRNIFRLRSILAVLALVAAGAMDLSAQTEGAAGGSDTRKTPIDLYLILEASGTWSERAAAVDWVCVHVVDGILLGGDRLSVWAAADKPRLVAALTVDAPENKESIKKTLRGMQQESAGADYAAALREAAAAEASRPSRTPIALALVVGGFTAGMTAAGMTAAGADALGGGSGGTDDLLRYSRVEDFPGWKAVTVGLGIGPQARSAAAAYMASRGDVNAESRSR